MTGFRSVIITAVILALPAAAFAQFQPRGDSGQNSTASQLLDVHGAGAQRSDPKSGDPMDYPEGHGPQGDVVRIENYVRAVRLISDEGLSYSIADTGQVTFWNNQSEITAGEAGRSHPGQDAAVKGLVPSYTDNGDGTVTDNVTGLMWQQDPGSKLTVSQAEARLRYFKLAGYDDWRLPTVKELYSLIQFSGRDVSSSSNLQGSRDSGPQQTGQTRQPGQTGSQPDQPGQQVAADISGFIPFIDIDYFEFEYGDERAGERIIDSQYLSSTGYVSTTMNGDSTVFGVNFADGRIKGYPVTDPRGSEKEFFVIYVRGNEDYGTNDYVDNGDGTITDRATGLMWMKSDTGGMDWQEALEWADGLEYAGYDDWRLPDAKELQSIVDYSRSPDTSRSAAIDLVFDTSLIWDEGNARNYPYFWTSTSHVDSKEQGLFAVYIAFGEALGRMSSGNGVGSEGQGMSSSSQPGGMSGPPGGGRR